MLWKATCQRPLPTEISDRPFTPWGPWICACFEAIKGGQICAHAPVHNDFPGGLAVK